MYSYKDRLREGPRLKRRGRRQGQLLDWYRSLCGAKELLRRQVAP